MQLMKKKLILPIAFLALVLAACGHDGKNTETVSKDKNEQLTTKSDNTAPSKDTEEPKQPASDSNEPQEQADTPATGYEEYPAIEKHVQNFSELNPVIETDNPNKRVILYKNGNGKNAYKSIYIKNEKRLKLIDLNGKGQIANEKLQ